MFSLICVWINSWVNNREAGDLRRHRGHYDVIVMSTKVVSHERHSALYHRQLDRLFDNLFNIISKRQPKLCFTGRLCLWNPWRADPSQRWPVIRKTIPYNMIRTHWPMASQVSYQGLSLAKMIRRNICSENHNQERKWCVNRPFLLWMYLPSTNRTYIQRTGSVPCVFTHPNHNKEWICESGYGCVRAHQKSVELRWRHLGNVRLHYHGTLCLNRRDGAMGLLPECRERFPATAG